MDILKICLKHKLLFDCKSASIDLSALTFYSTIFFIFSNIFRLSDDIVESDGTWNEGPKEKMLAHRKLVQNLRWCVFMFDEVKFF